MQGGSGGGFHLVGPCPISAEPLFIGKCLANSELLSLNLNSLATLANQPFFDLCGARAAL
jgi:hypothetical protein